MLYYDNKITRIESLAKELKKHLKQFKQNLVIARLKTRLMKVLIILKMKHYKSF